MPTLGPHYSQDSGSQVSTFQARDQNIFSRESDQPKRKEKDTDIGGFSKEMSQYTFHNELHR